MSIKIAHLSDLHFGKRFDVGLWQQLCGAVSRFGPNLLIVSGDFVDDPSPLHLLAAKSELERLAEDVHAKLYVVPGNHDLYESGVRVMHSRRNWFERVFSWGDTSEAERILAAQFGEPLGFTETYRRQAAVAPRVWRWFSQMLFGRHVAGYIDHLPVKPRARPLALVDRPDGVPVLIALLDSNAEDHSIGTATGSVSKHDLQRLSDALIEVDKDAHYLARIAVIHHHVLPIAYSDGKNLKDAEPLMVLHNAGTVLSVLKDHRFDLILHGHQHRQQFARIVLDPQDAQGYPISVAAAGSGSLATERNPDGNSCNFIEIATNGRIQIKSLFYGDAGAPDPDGVRPNSRRLFDEPLSIVKHRAFIRARERHGLECGSWSRQFEITENGDLVIDHALSGLKPGVTDAAFLRRPHDFFPSRSGHIIEDEIYLDRAAQQSLYKVELDAAKSDRSRRAWVILPDSAKGRAVDYTLHHGCANSIAMTQWEVEERWRDENKAEMPDNIPREEWVGTRVTHPVGALAISLKLPPSLAHVTPYLACRRHPEFPVHRIAHGDIVTERDSWADDDPDMRALEQQQLRFDPIHRTWNLSVLQPMVGYNYQLRWELPDEPIDSVVQGEVQLWRDLLLKAADPGSDLRETPQYTRARGAFTALCQTLETLLRRGGEDTQEKRGIELFVYNRTNLALEPAFTYKSWSSRSAAGFKIALGEGIVGAAFQQRRTIPWSKEVNFQRYINPVPYPQVPGEPSLELMNTLAMPLYHPRTANDDRPPPWSVIGAVCFSSDSPASKVVGLCTDSRSKQSEDLWQAARWMAQSLGHAVATKLE